MNNEEEMGKYIQNQKKMKSNDWKYILRLIIRQDDSMLYYFCKFI